MAVSRQALATLDLIEEIEIRSLEWGFTDGSLSEDEAFELGNRVSGDDDGEADGEDLIEELIGAKLIFELNGIGSSVRIRSRFAEMIRLVAANRQLFPNRPWRGASQLVADFRVDRRPRCFPRRDRLPNEVLDDHGAAIASTKLQRDLWEALTCYPDFRLAAFQERAATRIAATSEDIGTIVSAGTGSGKTIAFYLPAMLRIGEAVGSDYWVKAVAIYPRIELLKDQFAEAFRMARAVDAPLAAHNRRPLKIGALFGATPMQASKKELSDRGWRRHGQGFICPWMRCPTCDGLLLWLHTDLNARIEQLNCANDNCTGVVGEDWIILTRRRLQCQPPDILFTTTEILNRHLSNHWMHNLFGVGSPRAKKPFLALLDEVHTYQGATGAQTALTLRRWRHQLAAPIGWVGLSATLGDAARFFADLTGIRPDRVVEITPSFDEYEEEGVEYQILLRGDPASRASLLSTTIQTSMLVSRILDPPGASDVSGAFGRRAFLFTDDLDVTNRLYDDLRDAEAYTIFGKPDVHRLPLASIRQSSSDAALRDIEGQRWRICEDIGHPLDRRLIVSRTTSQDAGVNESANIVVATAALEVGFNDPLVGAIIQHKAPRGMASFLQRKGRAGRSRAMRPITLTVLSDYGRDRAFYQSYEQLFDPVLEPQNLPIRNSYVLKIQAVFAMFDWLAARTAGKQKASQWNLLSQPLVHPSQEVQTVVKKTKRELTKLVTGDVEAIMNLRGYLQSALDIDEFTAQVLLWEPPRSLLLEVVPTLVRRIFRNWQLAFPSPERSLDLQINYHPLPDFVPNNLFSDLNLPEVRVILPPATVNHVERTESMPILQALNHLVPGRVTRRFAPERGALSHWVAVNPQPPDQNWRIGDYAEEHELVGNFTGRLNEDVDNQPILVFRPWTVRLSKAAQSEALPSSNARLAWRTDIVANGEPLNVPIPQRSVWRDWVQAIDFRLHRFRSSASVRRFAPTAHANIRTLQGDFPVTLHFKSDDDRPAAVGFELEVDGFCLDFSLPGTEMVTTSNLPPTLAAACKFNYVRDAFRTDSDLPDDVNIFQRDWLFHILLSALLANAATTDRTLDAVAADILDDERLEGALLGVMEELFGAIPPDLPDDSEFDDDEARIANGGENYVLDTIQTRDARDGKGGVPPKGSSRLQQSLATHLGQPVVRERLRALADQLTKPDPERFSLWLRRLILDTLGEAVLQACVAVAPRQATADSLMVDIHDDSDSGIASVWVTEATPGGAGVIEAFAEHFVLDPRNFFVALEAALAATDLELVDGGLREILALASKNSEVADHMARLRATSSHSERSTLWQLFSLKLTRYGGVDLSHALSVSLNNRLLRSGSGPELDKLLLDLQIHWDNLEQRFGFAIELREFSYICSKDMNLSASVRELLATTLPAAAIGHVTVLAAITSLLWPRAHEVRLRSLQSNNPYRKLRSTDPAVARHLLVNRSITTIELADPDWHSQLDASFASQGACQLTANANKAAALRRAIVRLVATPVDVGVLQFFPVVERVERTEGRILVSLTLREQV